MLNRSVRRGARGRPRSSAWRARSSRPTSTRPIEHEREIDRQPIPFRGRGRRGDLDEDEALAPMIWPVRRRSARAAMAGLVMTFLLERSRAIDTIRSTCLESGRGSGRRTWSSMSGASWMRFPLERSKLRPGAGSTPRVIEPAPGHWLRVSGFRGHAYERPVVPDGRPALQARLRRTEDPRRSRARSPVDLPLGRLVTTSRWRGRPDRPGAADLGEREVLRWSLLTRRSLAGGIVVLAPGPSCRRGAALGQVVADGPRLEPSRSASSVRGSEHRWEPWPKHNM